MPGSTGLVRLVGHGGAARGLGQESIGAVPVSGWIFTAPLIELILHNFQDAGVSADEGREIFGLHHQCPDHVQRDHGRRTHAYLERGSFAYKLAEAAYGQDTFCPALVDADLDLAAEDHHDVIRPPALLHEPGAGRERPQGCYSPERFSLGRVKDVPEALGRFLSLGLSRSGLLLPLREIGADGRRLRTVSPDRHG